MNHLEQTICPFRTAQIWPESKLISKTFHFIKPSPTHATDFFPPKGSHYSSTIRGREYPHRRRTPHAETLQFRAIFALHLNQCALHERFVSAACFGWCRLTRRRLRRSVDTICRIFQSSNLSQSVVDHCIASRHAGKGFDLTFLLFHRQFATNGEEIYFASRLNTNQWNVFFAYENTCSIGKGARKLTPSERTKHRKEGSIEYSNLNFNTATMQR